MPNIKISNLSVMTSAASGDLIPIVDVSDLTMAATGTTKRVTQAVLASSILASAQPLDATLTALAGLTIAADSLAIGTGADAFTQTTFAANTLPARASTGSLVAKPITDFGLSLIDDLADSNARTTLGLGTIATQAASSIAITGGTINGATVGATTPATGAFTSLSATGITTVASGTELLPSIVSTTGTADTGLWFPAADTLAASTGGVQRIRINSTGNVGIGTTSPNTKLAVIGDVAIGTPSAIALPSGLPAAAQTLSIVSTGTAYGTGILARRGGDNATGFNLWNYSYGTYLDDHNDDTNAKMYFRLRTAGTPVTAMTLAASGNVGIGTTSPNAPLEVSKSSASIRISDTANNTGAGDVQSSLDLYGRYYSNDSVAYPVAKIAAIHQEANGTGGGVLAFSTQSAGFLTVAERMRIDKSGIVGIGTTSPNVNALLDVTSTTKAFMPPRMTTTQKNAIASPTAGMVVYDSTLNKLCVRAASAWETITSV